MTDDLRALEAGLDDAAQGLPRRLPTWIEQKYGAQSDMARIYDMAYSEEAGARRRAAIHAKKV